jgi:hypothetical protein
MDWSDQRTRVRRFLRDPDGNIWSNNLLLRLYNDEQHWLQNEIGEAEDVKSIRIPPKFQMGYMFDWEWPHNDSEDGEVYQCGYYWDADTYVFFHKWEAQHLAGVTPTSNALGANYTYPWEAWSAGTPAEPPPIYLPSKFYRAKFVAWDKKPIDHITEKKLYDRDPSWRSRKGNPQYYLREDKESNRIFLYPFPGSVTYQDTSDIEDDPDTADYATTGLDVDNNLLVIFDKEITEATTGTDESVFPKFIRKYIEYGVLAAAYGANTDGRIGSLADYWEMRRKVGIKAIKEYTSKRKVDRDYCFRTQSGQALRSNKHPRLPDAYPASYP